MNGAASNDPALAPASSLRRLAAAALDMVLAVLLYLVLFLYEPVLTVPVAMALLVNLTIYFAYFLGISRSKLGATPGQYLLRLKVVDATYGRPLTYHRNVARTLYMLLPFTPFLFFQYIYFPYLLNDRAEFRESFQPVRHKILAGQPLTPAEQKRWNDFQVYVQEPSTNMLFHSLWLTGGALAVWGLVMIWHPRRQTIHDIICQTIVINEQKFGKVN